MEMGRVGSIIRAVRLRHRWRQVDVASRAGVSPTTVSRIERGRFDRFTVGTILRVCAALDSRVDWIARWRGGELDRMLNAGHAALHETVARRLVATGWRVSPEATFSIFGERGAIDLLAVHPSTGTLLVVEL